MRKRKLVPEFYPPEDTLKIFGKPRARALSGTIRVLVWNIYKGRKKDWARDLQAMAGTNDLVLLQEAVLNSRHDHFFENTDRFEWVMAQSFRDRKTHLITGVKTGSVAPSTEQIFFHSPDREPVSKTPKMLLGTVYPLEGSASPLLVLNMHAINFVSQAKFVRHIDQMARALEDHAGPVILGGDFNTWNAARRTYLFETIEKAGLKEVQWPRRARLQHLNQHLDHVFYRGLDLRSAKSVTNSKASDHHPILVEFALAPQ